MAISIVCISVRVGREARETPWYTVIMMAVIIVSAVLVRNDSNSLKYSLRGEADSRDRSMVHLVGKLLSN